MYRLFLRKSEKGNEGYSIKKLMEKAPKPSRNNCCAVDVKLAQVKEFSQKIKNTLSDTE